MLLKVTQRGEKLGTNLTIERLPVVQTFVGSQSIPGVERLPAGTVRTNEWLDFGVNADVDLLTVGCEESLTATILGAFEFIFTPMSFHVGS